MRWQFLDAHVEERRRKPSQRRVEAGDGCNLIDLRWHSTRTSKDDARLTAQVDLAHDVLSERLVQAALKRCLIHARSAPILSFHLGSLRTSDLASFS